MVVLVESKLKHFKKYTCNHVETFQRVSEEFGLSFLKGIRDSVFNFLGIREIRENTLPTPPFKDNTLYWFLPSANNLLNIEVLQKKKRYINICFSTSWCSCWELVRRSTASNTLVIFDIPLLLLMVSLSVKGFLSRTLPSNP